MFLFGNDERFPEGGERNKDLVQQFFCTEVFKKPESAETGPVGSHSIRKCASSHSCKNNSSKDPLQSMMACDVMAMKEQSMECLTPDVWEELLMEEDDDDDAILSECKEVEEEEPGNIRVISVGDMLNLLEV